MAQYTKAIATLVASVLAVLASAIGAGSLDDIDTQGWVRIAVLVLGGSAATWFVENVAGLAGGIIKAVVATATAFLVSLQSAYENDGVVTQSELLTAFSLALLALVAVYQLRHVPPSNACRRLARRRVRVAAPARTTPGPPAST